MKRVIITGAASMLGIALTKECISNGTEVTAVARPGSQRNCFIPVSPLVKVIETDLSAIGRNLKKIKAKFGAFYHLGWAKTDKKGRNDPLQQAKNIEYTLACVKLAAEKDCGCFVGAGSQAEYGRMTEPARPEMPVSPEFAYAIAKYSAGKLSAIYSKEKGIRHVWARIFSAYGPCDMPSTMIMYCISKLLKNEKPQLTGCEQMWDYIYCGDAAKALYLLGKKGRDQAVYNIASGEARPLKKFVRMLGDAVGARVKPGIGGLKYAHGQVMYLCADVTGLRKDTGFKPVVSFAEGIKKTIEWARENLK